MMASEERTAVAAIDDLLHRPFTRRRAFQGAAAVGITTRRQQPGSGRNSGGHTASTSRLAASGKTRRP